MERKTIWDGSVRVGEDVITTDRDGLTHVAHYDSHNSLIGRSYETRDHKGEIYMIHEDAKGNRLGRGTVERDWWGDYYVKTEETAWARRQRQEEAKRNQERNDEDSDPSAGILGDALYGIVMFVLKIFGLLFIGTFLFQFVFVAGCTIWPFVLMPVLNGSENLSVSGPVYVMLTGLLEMVFWPYAGILLYRRWKKEINWKDVFIAILRWAIIGPFAYRWLLGKKKEKTTKEYNPHRPYDLPLWQCPTCGKNIFTAGRFCPNCGTQRPDHPSFYTALCPNCGKPIKVKLGEKTGVCGECGHPYDFARK